MIDTENSRPQISDDWQGLREIDRAIAEDRLTAYTWKKAWADPWGRLKLIAIFCALVGFAVFVFVNDVIL